MKVKDINSRDVDWFPEKRKPTQHKMSKLATRALGVIRKVLPVTAICHEVRIPGSNLRLDFWVPSLRLAIEVDGRQHDRFVPHLHKDPTQFHRQQARDRQKESWCEMNEFVLVRLPHDDSDDIWKQRVKQAVKEALERCNSRT